MIVWIHLGILRTRGGELVASCNLLYCLVTSDASCGTLLGALVLERRYRSCCWTDRISPPSLVVGQMVALNIYSVLLRPADMYCAWQSVVSLSR